MTGPADPALGLARAQHAAGLDVAIAIDRLRPGNMLEKVEASGVRLVDGPILSTKAGPIKTLRDLGALARVTSDFDVVHAHASHDHTLAAFASRARWLVRSIHHPRGVRRRGLQGWLYGRTDAFIFPAEAHRERFLENYRHPADRTAVVRGAVDEARFHPDVDGRAVRRAEGIPEDALVIGMIARIKPGRGHEQLLEAFSRIPPGARDVRLVFIGKGEGEADLDASIRARGLADRTHRYGFRDADLPQAIRGCDVTVLLEEGNDAGCRAVLESLALGVPVIGSAHPAIAEALEGADAGWIVPVRDTEALRRALEEAIADPSALERLGANGRRRIEARHTDAERARRIGSLYEALAAGGAEP